MASYGVERRFRALGNTFVNLDLEPMESPETEIAHQSQRRRSTSCRGAIQSKDRMRDLSPVSRDNSGPGPNLEGRADTSTNTEQVQIPDEQVETRLACPQPPKSKAETKCVQAKGGEVTTMMIRNLPKVSQSDFLNVLNKSGLKSTYRFAYMPCNFHEGKGKGYAFVDFCNADVARKMQKSWNKATIFGKIELLQPLSVAAAAVQGFEANVKKWMNTRTNRIRNPYLRPFIAILPENSPPCPLAECEPCDAWSSQEAVPTSTCAHEELGVADVTNEELVQMLPPFVTPEGLRYDQCARNHMGGINAHPLQRQEIMSTAPTSYTSQRHVEQQQVTHTAWPNERDGRRHPTHLLPNLLTSFGERKGFGIEAPVTDFLDDIATPEQTKCTVASTYLSEGAQQVHVPLPSLPLALLHPPPPPLLPPSVHSPPSEAPAPILFDSSAAVPLAPQTQLKVRTQQYSPPAVWPNNCERPGLAMQTFPVITSASIWSNYFIFDI